MNLRQLSLAICITGLTSLSCLAAEKPNVLIIIADDLGYSSMDVVSGAGHDAVYLARVAPAAMIFVPCDDGISHNEIENAAAEHLEAGCNVLLRAMLAAAEVVA